MNNNVFFDLSKKYNNIPNNSHVRCCQFILVETLLLVFALIGPPCLVALNSQFCCLAMQKKVSPTLNFFDYRTNKTGKMLPHMKYSSKRSDFLRFHAYLCHVIDDFCLSWFAALRQVKNLTWQNPELIGFAACLSKNFLLLRYL